MTNQRCDRSWQAEAIEDGQIVGADRASFERHAATCVPCAGEVAALARLRETMQRVQTPPMTALEQRRLHASLLQRAHEHRRTNEARSLRRAWLALPLVAVLLTLVVWGLGRRPSSPHASVAVTASASAPEPVFEIVSVSGGRFASHSAEGTTRATLSDGVAAFHVAHLAPGQRFLVDLPDGELEVHGTRFVVDVEGGARTRSVDVSEGVVSLRLRGAGERVLRAGERWNSTEAAHAAAAPATTSHADPLSVPAAAPSPRTPSPPRADSSPRASAPRASAPSGEVPSAATTVAAPDPARREASDRFAAAVGAFRGGQYASADRLLAAFVADFPGDARCEDAYFLRAVSRSRAGDPRAAADLARAYLRRYPQGLRRSEAESLANAVDSTP